MFKKICIIWGILALLYGCTYLRTIDKKGNEKEFMHVGTAAFSYQTIKGEPFIIIADDNVLEDITKILIDKGLIIK